jgi:hypothetical protein
MTERPPTRATERIARRKELRQARLIEAQRRRSNRTRLRVALAAIIIVLLGLLTWFGIAFFLPPVAAFAAGAPAEADAVARALVGIVRGAFEMRMEPWLVS